MLLLDNEVLTGAMVAHLNIVAGLEGEPNLQLRAMGGADEGVLLRDNLDYLGHALGLAGLIGLGLAEAAV